MLDLFACLYKIVKKDLIGKVVKRTATLILLLFILVPNHDLYGDILPSQYFSKVTWGIGAGVIFETGTLNGELTPGFNLNVLTWWPLPVKNLFIVSNMGLDYFFLDNSPSSNMYALYLEGGLGYRVPIHRYLQPYGGILLHGSYLHVDAHRLEEKEDTFKPGLVLEAGIFSEITKGFGLKVGLKGKFAPLSNELYSPLTIEIAATFRYASMKDNNDAAGNQLSLNLQKVRSALTASSVDEAERILNKILIRYPENEEAGSLQKQVEAINKNYARGKALYLKGLYIEALPFLDKSFAYYTDAMKKSTAVRARYAKRIPVWEREGVRAYEKQNYDTCITIMRKIILIDPRNRIGRIYLPRAIKRKQALKSLH